MTALAGEGCWRFANRTATAQLLRSADGGFQGSIGIHLAAVLRREVCTDQAIFVLEVWDVCAIDYETCCRLHKESIREMNCAGSTVL